MPDPIAPAAPTAPATVDQRNPKSVAASIVNGIHNKANGSQPDPKANGQQPPTPPADPNAGKEKYVVDGKDVWLTPNERTAWIQKGMAFEPKVTQLSHLQNEMGAFLQTLATDPLKILTDKRIGMTPEAVMKKIFASGHISDEMKETAGQWYYENVVLPAKSPEEYAQAQKDKKLSEYERQEKARADNKIIEDNKTRVNDAMNHLKAQIGEAMKESGLPDNNSPQGALMARRVADVMRLGYFQRQAVTPKQAIEKVKSELKFFTKSFYDTLDGDALVAELGEANVDKVKKFLLKLVEPPNGLQPNKPRLPSTPRGERKTISLDEFHDQLDELKKKG